ncbi:MAG: hypothetical protein LBS73_07165 [Campylobacteraceae bacterium]|nr:hypothetical protein [Campylobacteraceae bacterium]
MATFVHLSDEKNTAAIIKNGIKGEVVFCMPVITDFYATHQWLREMRRCHRGCNIIAIYFKIPDDEMVLCGNYLCELERASAKKAHEIFLNLPNKLGFQVMVERKILKAEITRTKHLPQTIGWRYFPASNGKQLCFCPACISFGSYKSRSLRQAEIKKLFKALRVAADNELKIGILYEIADMRCEIEGGDKNEAALSECLDSSDMKLKCAAIDCAQSLYGKKYRDFFLENIYNIDDKSIIEASIWALKNMYKDDVLSKIDMTKCSELALEVIKELLVEE